MNWFRKAQRGEWWIIDGQAVFADGDVGDMNHEAYVIQSVQAKYAYDEFAKGEWIDWEGFKKKLAIEAFAEEYGKQPTPQYIQKYKEEMEDFYLKKLKEMGMTNEEYMIAEGMGDARAYGMEYLGWKRVNGNNVQTQTLTVDDLKTIASGLWDINNELSENDTTPFNIEVVSTGAFYTDVPYSLISDGSPSVLRQYQHVYAKSEKMLKTARDYLDIGHNVDYEEDALWCSPDGVQILKGDAGEGHAGWKQWNDQMPYSGRYDGRSKEISVSLSRAGGRLTKTIINNLLRAFPDAKTIYVFTPASVEPEIIRVASIKTAKDYTEIGHRGRKHVLWQSRDGVNIEKSGKEWEDTEDGHSEWTNKIGMEAYEGRYDIESKELSVVSSDYREIPKSLINNLLRAFPDARTLYIYTAFHGQPEVIRVASRNWFKTAQASDELWKAVMQLFSQDLNPDNAKGCLNDHEEPRKELIGKINYISVYMVNGGEVKTKYEMDFVEGGNEMAYDFIPENEVWVDAFLDLHELKFVIYHELIERDFMIREKLDYEQAHGVANQKEKKIREMYEPV